MKTDAQVKCLHCGTLFTPKSGEEYCCQGCAYVARLRRENGFEHFYELRGGKALPPAGSRVFQKSDFSWLAEAVREVEAAATGPSASGNFRITGLSCVGCVWNVEKLFARCPGAVETRIDVQSQRIELKWTPGAFDAVAFAQQLKEMGYGLQPMEQRENVGEAPSSRLALRVGLCGAFVLNTMLFTLPVYVGLESTSPLAPLFHGLAAVFATASMLVGGSYFIKRAWKALGLGVIHIDLPIALGLLAAYGGSVAGWATGHAALVYFDFVSTFIFLMLGGRWLQEYALDRNQAHLDKQDPAPRTVRACGGGRDGEKLPVAELQPGQDYVLAPGEVNPVAADLLDDDALISLEWINGEAEPLPLTLGRTLPAGAINVGLGARRVRAKEAWADSLLARLLERPDGPGAGSGMQRVLQVYLVAVLVLAAGGGAAWLFATGDLVRSAAVLISVLVVSCPCALGVALPTADEFAISRLRRAGLFIKHAGIWARLGRVRAVVFDKTGTLTMDTPELHNTQALAGLDGPSRVALFALVRDNLHPVARCLRAALLGDEASWRALRDGERRFGPLAEAVGQGVSIVDDQGHRWSLGRHDWLAGDAPAEQPKACCCGCGGKKKEARDNAMGPAGASFRVDGRLLAAFEFSDDVRDDAVETVRWLRERGLGVAILSGDAPERVQRVAEALGVPGEAARGACTPADKAAWIDANAPGAALMIGDGANDSLAFSRAICRGTPVVDRNVLESASDFFFFGRSLKCLSLLLETAARRRRTIRRIFTLAVVYNAVAVGLCLAGLMNPLLAAVLMPISSIASLGIAVLGR